MQKRIDFNCRILYCFSVQEAKKQVIKYELYEKLAEVGILPGRSVMLKLKLMPRRSQN